jgi:DHA2 family multidrug resistance protein
MAIWAVAAMAAPAIGPVLGGWLTSAYSWRYVFYVNVPVGCAAFAGLWVFLRGASENARPKLDWLGFATLGLAIAAFQVMLDRGSQLDWFSSGEIVIEALVAGSAFYIFLVHILTARDPFLRPSLLKDRNFTAGMLFGTIIGLTYYASLALQPPYLQNLMGYPILTTGLVLAPSGLGQMAASMIAGRLIGKADTRMLLGLGLGLTAWSFYARIGWTPDVAPSAIISAGLLQGAGLGFLFAPLSVVALSSLSADNRAQGAGFFTLTRNLGSSSGIAVVNALLVANTQANHADISRYVTPTNPAFLNPAVAHIWSPYTAAGRAALDAVVTRQAQVIAYIDDYKLLMLATLAVCPLLLVFRKPAVDPASAHHMVPE